MLATKQPAASAPAERIRLPEVLLSTPSNLFQLARDAKLARFLLSLLVPPRDLLLKFLTHAADGGLTHALLSPWALAALAASIVAFYSSARSLQIGPALAVIAFTSVAANLIAISGGILVFHDSIGAGAPQIIGRMLAFCLVIAGAALMPAPTRARQTSAEPAATRPSPASSPA